MIVTILNAVVPGLLLGGLFGLIAVGLSLQYGVARVLNISHGEFIMLGALTTWTLYTAFDFNPLGSLAIVGPVAFILGFVIHRTLFKRLLTSSASPRVFEGNSMLASFGLLFIIQNIAFQKSLFGTVAQSVFFSSLCLDLNIFVNPQKLLYSTLTHSTERRN